MTTTMNPQKIGLTFGCFVGFVHLVWSALVAFGLAQPYLDTVFRLHMIEPVFRVAPFSITTAIVLVIVAFIIGNIIGYVFAHIWNKIHQGIK